MEIKIFNGNCPKSVSKDAKYSIKNKNGELNVCLVYESEEDEMWYLSTNKHEELIDMVNSAKTFYGGQPNGAFYINEYKQVIVPVYNNEEEIVYLLAGEYKNEIEFDFEGKIISGRAVDFDNNPLKPGDVWPGAHQGIPYVLAAGGNDIYYKYSPRPNVEKKVKLSKEIGSDKASKVANMIMQFKGGVGGRFYVNEFLNIFAPFKEGFNTEYIYIGKIELENWFRKVE